jgi:hypothetical protein
MYVCVNVCVWYLCMHLCVRVYQCMHACMHVYQCHGTYLLHSFIHPYIHTFVYAHIRTYIHTYVHTCTHKYKRAFSIGHILMHAYVCMCYVCMHARLNVCVYVHSTPIHTYTCNISQILRFYIHTYISFHVLHKCKHSLSILYTCKHANMHTFVFSFYIHTYTSMYTSVSIYLCMYVHMYVCIPQFLYILQSW